MKKLYLPVRAILLLLGIALTLVQCKNEQEEVILPSTRTGNFSGDIANDWFDLSLKLTKETPGFSPPVAARAFGYTGLALYEAVRPGMQNYRSMEGQINGLEPGTLPEIEKNKDYNWGVVANAALATAIKNLYRIASISNLEAMAALEKKYEEQFAYKIPPDVFERSKAYGKAVGNAIYEYSKTDGQDLAYSPTANFPLSYFPPKGEEFWVPTPLLYQTALQPYWGDVRPFLTENVTKAQPPNPPFYSSDPSSTFYQEATEVFQTVKNLTEEQKIIAEYWSDDPGQTFTPAGHSIAILRQVLIKEKANLARAAEAYAKLGMGLHDAFISCWKSKYVHNVIRPISYIHRLMDSEFNIVLATPPFPEYTSGHSVQIGAMAEILTDMFGENYTITDRSHEGRTDINGQARSFKSFYELADETGISRLYGGIHYRSAIELGLVQGKDIGRNINGLKFR